MRKKSLRPETIRGATFDRPSPGHEPELSTFQNRYLRTETGDYGCNSPHHQLGVPVREAGHHLSRCRAAVVVKGTEGTVAQIHALEDDDKQQGGRRVSPDQGIARRNVPELADMPGIDARVEKVYTDRLLAG